MHMLVSAIFLLIVSGASVDSRMEKRSAIRTATVSVTIIHAERVGPMDELTKTRQKDRQIRERDEKALVEFY